MYVGWFKQYNKGSIGLVGGKNANLGEMINANIRVPPGFAVTTDAYRDVLRQSGIDTQIYRILSRVHSSEDISPINQASEEIRHLIESIAMPPEIEEPVESYYQSLGEQCGMAAPQVSVRSSATAEDLPTASFAGQQDTYLWVREQDELKRKIIKCWASLFTPRAISYRIKMGFPHEKVLISVGVQKMVNAKIAGVIFTLNPANGDPSKIAVSGSWGLGETVVSGEVTPDEFLVDKITLEIVRRTISPKTIECIVDEEGKLVTREVPSERQDITCLSDEEIIELARVVKLIEQHYGAGQDIEWAIDKHLSFPDNVFILQSRAETVWTQRERASLVKPGESGMGYLASMFGADRKLR